MGKPKLDCKTRNKMARELMGQLGGDVCLANFMIAQELGEIGGDVPMVDDVGNVVHRDPYEDDDGDKRAGDDPGGAEGRE